MKKLELKFKVNAEKSKKAFLFLLKNNEEDTIVGIIDENDNMILERNDQDQISLDLYIERSVFHDMSIEVENSINIKMDGRYSCDIKSFGNNFDHFDLKFPKNQQLAGIFLKES